MSEQNKRWTYPTAVVEVGGNSQKVRCLTAGERKRFGMASREIKSGAKDANELPALIVSLAAIEPTMSEAEAEDMPPDLIDACVAKIMELSGFKDDDDSDKEGDEKKANTSS